MSTPIQNVNLGRPCRVKHDRLRHESYEDAQTVVYKRCLSEAQDDFNLGELDEEIREAAVDENNSFVALALNALYGTHGAPLCYGPMPVDFATVERIVDAAIERRTRELMEEAA